MSKRKKQETKEQPVVIKETTKPSSLNSKLLKIILPHAIAVLVFVLVTVIFFSPMLLDNKVIQQSDIIQYKGMSQEIAQFRAKTGDEALWTNSMFGGMPAFQISVMYKGNLLNCFDKILSLGFPHPSELLFIALICFYILLITLGVNPYLSIAGSLAYSLCSFNLVILEAGHTSEMHAIGLMPLTVAGIIMLRNKKYLWGGIWTAIALSMQIAANHLQITYYLMLLLVVYAIVELVYAIKAKDLKGILFTGAIAAACTVFGGLTNLSLLWSTQEYLPSTIRGPSELSSNTQSSGGLDEDYAFQWSYGNMEALTLLIPNFYGGSSSEDVGMNSNTAEVLKQFNVPTSGIESFVKNVPTYWGDVPFTSGPVYIGAIICFLFLLGILMVKEKWKWWLLAASVLSLSLAWGKNFSVLNDFLFHHLPGYNKFRTPSMSLVIITFSSCLLSFVFLSNLVKGVYEKAEVMKKLKWSVYLTGGLCLLFIILGGSLLSFTTPNDAGFRQQMMQATGNNQKIVDGLMSALVKDRASLLRTDSIRSLIFILLAAALLWLWLKEKIKANILYAGLGLLMFIDLATVGMRYLNKDDFVSKSDYDRYFTATPVDNLIMKETSLDYRVFNLATNTFNDSRTSYYHKSIGGYHAAKLRRYQEIIEHQLTRDSTRETFNEAVIDMLNTKYIIFKQGDNEQVAPNTNALDNAWFVDSIKIVDNADAEMAALNNFHPASTVIIDKRFESQLSGLSLTHDSTATVKMLSYAPNDLQYQSHSSSDGIIVFSEIYYQPGWNAYIDGKQADHFRCNYILRGMKIPAGDHQIEFKFHPESFYTGETIAKASSGIILLLLAAAIGLEYYKRRKTAL